MLVLYLIILHRCLDIMNESNNSSIKINSTARSPEDQARIMSENVEGQGMKSQRALYGSRGQKSLQTPQSRSYGKSYK